MEITTTPEDVMTRLTTTNPTMTSHLVTTTPLLTDLGAREITPDDPPDVRALAEMTEEGANVSRDGLYIYESAVADLASDGSVRRALAVRLDMTGDHIRDLAVGDYQVCEVGAHPTFGVVAVELLEGGHGSWAAAGQRAETLLAAAHV